MQALRDRVGWIAATSLHAIVAALSWASATGAQTSGSVRGMVKQTANGAAVSLASVSVIGSAIRASTDSAGRYQLPGVPAGHQTIEARAFGFAPRQLPIDVVAGKTTIVDIELEANALRLADVVVRTASRAPERIVEAPAAITIVPQAFVSALAPSGQAPLVLSSVAGVDLVQNGVNDFNVNARGFNSSLTRRVLVLEDGRDVALPFLGSQEWAALGALDDVSRIELVRGPGSALYGANAFSGVLSLTSIQPRDAVGTRVTLTAGELSTRRVDARQAGLFAGNRFGYKVSAGYSTSDTWARSRTSRDSGDIAREYARATDSLVSKSREARPLAGQRLDSTTLAAVGDRDPVTSAYGSARVDYYAPGGSLATVEGGLADIRNETLLTGIGRVQLTGTRRPWARAAWSASHVNVLAWYTGRDTYDPEWSLGSNTFFLEKSAVVHGEVQYNNSLPADRGRWIVGVSARSTHMNTSETLIAPANDDRADELYSAFGQLELRVLPRLKLVTASRWDDGNLISPQFSPKAALVYSLSADRSFRVTVNRAFQTPNYTEFFLHANAGAPTTSPRALESALESFLATGRAIGTTGLPSELPWNFDEKTSILALGNAKLGVERITGYELGYQGTLMRRGYVTADLYWNDTRDFVTDLLPNVNAMYPQYRYDDQGTNVPAYLDAIAARAASLSGDDIPEAQRQQIIAGAQALKKNYAALVAATQPLLATVDGHRALVVSYANAGRMIERGAELGADMQVTDELRAAVSYAYFDFSVRTASAGTDALVPNTPRHKAAMSLIYEGTRRLELSSTLRLVSGYPWAAGVYSGYIPAAQTLNASAAFQASANMKVFVTGTNVLDQRRFEIYGGSVIGRRILGGVTATLP